MKKAYLSPSIERLTFTKESILNASKDIIVYDEFAPRSVVTPEDQTL